MLRSEDYFFYAAVGADAYVVGPADIDGVNEVIENMFMRGNGGRSDEIRHEIYTEITAAIGE